MWKGFKNPLQFEDVWKVEPEYRSSHVAPEFEEHWRQSLEKARRYTCFFFLNPFKNKTKKRTD